MSKNPEISVIVSTYNRHRAQGDCPSLLERALKSILQQTFTDFELVLIDDASTDKTKEVCLQYAQKDNRIQLILHENNSGFPAKRYNEGIQKSRGRFITFMFDDDEWLPNALADLYSYYTDQSTKIPNIGFVYGLCEFYDVSRNLVMDPTFGGKWNLRMLKEENFLANCCVILPREVIDTVGGYDEHPLMRRSCDWDLWQRIGRRYKVLRMPTVVARVYQFQTDSIGTIVPWFPKEAQAYVRNRTYFPLKSKPYNWTQQWRYFCTFFVIYNPVFIVIITLRKTLKAALRAFLNSIGCLTIAKKTYRMVKDFLNPFALSTRK